MPTNKYRRDDGTRKSHVVTTIVIYMTMNKNNQWVLKLLAESLMRIRIFIVSKCLLSNSLLLTKEKMATTVKKPDGSHLSPVIKVNVTVTGHTGMCASQHDAPGRKSLTWFSCHKWVTWILLGENN